MKKKHPSLRDKAIEAYTIAHVRMYDCTPDTNLSGVSNEEIWQMADDLENMANREALEAFNSYEGAEEESVFNTGGAFSTLGELLG